MALQYRSRPIITQDQINVQRGLDRALAGLYPVGTAALDVAFRTALLRAVAAAMEGCEQNIDGVARQFTKQEIGEKFLLAHRDVGLAAQRSVVAAYARRRGRRDLPSYRTSGNRYAGGRLLRALQAPDFFEARIDGLGFINEDRLNREARHWKRLNFGAGGLGRAGPAPQRYNLEYNGLVIAALGLDPDPRDDFLMPPGIFLSPESRASQAFGAAGTGRFFPRRRTLLYPTRGIRASNFLDAGVRRIARELPRAYEDVYGEIFNKSIRRQRVRLLRAK